MTSNRLTLFAGNSLSPQLGRKATTAAQHLSLATDEHGRYVVVVDKVYLWFSGTKNFHVLHAMGLLSDASAGSYRHDHHYDVSDCVFIVSLYLLLFRGINLNLWMISSVISGFLID